MPTLVRADGRRGGRPPKYLWDDILDFTGHPGARKILLKGTHYPLDVKFESFRAQVISAARRKGITVTTSRQGENLVISLFGAPVGGYPWDDIFDGEARYYTQGVDFGCPVFEFIQLALREALSRGIDVRVYSPAVQGAAQVGLRAILNEPAPTIERVDP